MGELYGEEDKLTLEWKDGLMAISVRHAVQVCYFPHSISCCKRCKSVHTKALNDSVSQIYGFCFQIRTLRKTISGSFATALSTLCGLRT